MGQGDEAEMGGGSRGLVGRVSNPDLGLTDRSSNEGSPRPG